MAGVNKWIGIGNLTKDPEIRYTKDEKPVASFSIACNEDYKDKEGNKVEKVEFIRIVAYRKLAEICGQYLSKGKPVFVEGKMRNKSWTDSDNNNRYSTEIEAREVVMLGRGEEKPVEREKEHEPVDTEDVGF